MIDLLLEMLRIYIIPMLAAGWFGYDLGKNKGGSKENQWSCPHCKEIGKMFIVSSNQAQVSGNIAYDHVLTFHGDKIK